MTRTHARPYSSYQEPPSPRVVALSNVVGGWWPDLVTHCPHCGSRLRVEPPSGGESGRVYCVQCGREVADVVQTLRSRPALTRDQLYPRRGRPPKAQPIDDNRLCPTCQTRRRKKGRQFCEPCVAGRQRARACYVRLIAALEAAPHPMRSRELAPLVGCAKDSVRRLIQQARVRGAPVVTEGHRYWIVRRSA